MKYVVTLHFAKYGEMRWISHLDLMRLIQRAARRAGLPLLLSKGFSPHPKMHFKRALKLGVESLDEEFSLELTEPLSAEELKRRLNAQLPKGIEVK